MKLQDLTANTDIDTDNLAFALERPYQTIRLAGFGVGIIDWNIIGCDDSRQTAVLFDFQGNRYGYYTDNGETILAELDKGYRCLTDWGMAWNDCPPDVLCDMIEA